MIEQQQAVTTMEDPFDPDKKRKMDVALRHAPATAYISCNRSFFNPRPEKRHALDQCDGVTPWSILQHLSPYLCLGSASTALGR